jgi:hypothetical protein
MDRPLTILHIEDNPNDAEMVRRRWRRKGSPSPSPGSRRRTPWAPPWSKTAGT